MNDLAAQYYVAVCYEYGFVVEKDLTKAFKLYRKAAERGLPDAMYHIASFYKDGLVVPQNSTREREWQRMFEQKGGRFVLPDFIHIYELGLKKQENYALTPSTNTAIALGKQEQQITINITEQHITNNTINQQPLSPEVTNRQPVNSTLNNSISDVDTNIPINKKDKNNTFAVIIGNYDYLYVNKVPFVNNDVRIFSEYCLKTLGLPDNNVRVYENATYGSMIGAMSNLQKIAKAFKNDINVIVYYAGHGIPDEASKEAYLLPIDADGMNTEVCYPLSRLYKELSELNARQVTVFFDACFSGADRNNGMVVSARGVAIKPKSNHPLGNTVVFSAATGQQTAYPYKEKSHGMFTYYLLKKLQETKGEVTLGELGTYISDETAKQAVLSNGKEQTPTVLTPIGMSDEWKKWKMR